jgi:hypothetical protein
MRTWETNTTVPGSPSAVLELLTEPEAIAQWAPVPFEIVSLAGRRLYTGSRARVAGRAIEFEVTVFEVSSDRLALAADGPISIDVQYFVRAVPGGSDVRASVSVEGRGLFGRVLASATEALLAAGALRSSLDRLGRQLDDDDDGRAAVRESSSRVQRSSGGTSLSVRTSSSICSIA